MKGIFFTSSFPPFPCMWNQSGNVHLITRMRATYQGLIVRSVTSAASVTHYAGSLLLQVIQGMHACSVMPHSAIPWTVARQIPLSIAFPNVAFRNRSRLPFPSSGDLSDPGIEPGSPSLQADALLSEPPGKCWETGETHGLWTQWRAKGR